MWSKVWTNWVMFSQPLVITGIAKRVHLTSNPLPPSNISDLYREKLWTSVDKM